MSKWYGYRSIDYICLVCKRDKDLSVYEIIKKWAGKMLVFLARERFFT